MFTVTQLHDGPRFEPIKSGFPRASAALAWLIDSLNARGAKAIFPEQDTCNPDCFDVLADLGGYAEQFTIEPTKGA